MSGFRPISPIDSLTRDPWNETLGLNKAEEVMERVENLKSSFDILLWLPKKNGCFTTKSAWDAIRFRSPNFEWAKWVWHKWLPKKIAICMWKAVFECLSVDEKVRRVGVFVISVCDCCDSRQSEDLEHVLNKREFATDIWRKVSVEVGVPFLRHQSWKERVQIWFNKASRYSQLRTLMGLIPCLVVWRLWRKRCVARMKGKLESSADVWLSIKHWVGVLSKNMTDMNHLNESNVQILNNLEVPIANKKNKAMQVVRWLKSRQGHLKINLDRSSFGNPGPVGGGGILRDCTGSLIFGFSNFFGLCSNNEAELRVVLEGINFCTQLGMVLTLNAIRIS